MNKTEDPSDRFVWKPGDVQWQTPSTTAQKIAATIPQRSRPEPRSG
jgi:hypothetical protein